MAQNCFFAVENQLHQNYFPESKFVSAYFLPKTFSLYFCSLLSTFLLTLGGEGRGVPVVVKLSGEIQWVEHLVVGVCRVWARPPSLWGWKNATGWPLLELDFSPRVQFFFFTSHWNYWMIFCWIWNRITPPRGPNWRLEYSGCLEKGDLSKRTWNWKTKKIHQLGKIDLFALASPIPTHFTHFRPISAPWKWKFMRQPTFQNA